MKWERVIRCKDRIDEMRTESGIRLGKEKYEGGNLILQNQNTGEEVIAKWGMMVNGKFYEPCQNDCTSQTCMGLKDKKHCMCRRKMEDSKCGYYAEI